MSEQNVDVVRRPVTLRTKTRRRLEERFVLRFPRASAFLVRAVWRLPPRSRLRQVWVRHVVQLGFEALNRDDVEPAFALYHPDVELILPQGSLGSASTRPFAVAKSA
jgi:hypothetical protein